MVANQTAEPWHHVPASPLQTRSECWLGPCCRIWTSHGNSRTFISKFATTVMVPRFSWVPGHVQQHLTPASTLGGFECRFPERDGTRLCWCTGWPDDSEKQRPGGDICAVKFTGLGHEHWLATDEVA